MKNIFRIEPLDFAHLELVRTWRNQDSVRLNMEYQDFISSEQQVQWFTKTQQDHGKQYFVFYSHSKPIGLVHLSDIDEEKATAQVGLFVGDEGFHGTGAALQASLFILDRAFIHLKLKQLFAKVKRDNSAATQYNAFLGFEFFREMSGQFDEYQLSHENFQKRKEKIQRICLV
jgi:UDP-4-amino-4,6-dideoxy-N-acetyl-beta-L-altrosamine N-acetyltransferase